VKNQKIDGGECVEDGGLLLSPKSECKIYWSFYDSIETFRKTFRETLCNAIHHWQKLTTKTHLHENILQVSFTYCIP
jgi:hypothetical protein